MLEYAERNKTDLWYSISDPAVLEEEGVTDILSKCHGALVPDEPMKNYLDATMPWLLVLVQKTVISYEMQVLSSQVLNHFQPEKDALPVFAYVAAGKGHYADLEEIAPDIKALMEEDEGFRLRIIGRMDLPPELKYFDERIDVVPFSSWLSLYESLAGSAALLIPHSPDSDTRQIHMDSRFMEASLMAIPTISDDASANIVVSDQPSGCAGRWKEAMEDVLRAPHIAAMLGKESQEKVLREQTSESLEENVRRIFGV